MRATRIDIVNCAFTFLILILTIVLVLIAIWVPYSDDIKQWWDSKRNTSEPIVDVTPSEGTDEHKHSPVETDGLQVDDRVIVIKARRHLLIRRDSKKTSKRIGHAANGAKGTIIEGPVAGPKGYTWFRIEWDKKHTIGWNRKVMFYSGHLKTEKWSAEKNEKGTRHLKKIIRR